MSIYLLPDSTCSTNDGLDVPTAEGQSYNGNSLWHFDSTDADTSVPQRSGGILGSHSLAGISDIISNASEKDLDQNVFHARMKWAFTQQKIENSRLQELGARQRKELDELRLLNTAYKEMIGQFATEYKETRPEGVDGESLSIATIQPKPNLRNRADYPLVPFWIKEEFSRSLRGAKKGETDGEAMSVEPPARRGRPRNDVPDDSKSNLFLHNADGTRVSKESLRYLSERARMIWISLDKKHMAPKTFTGITKPAWDYFTRIILNDPKLDFLLLCDDAEWKLRLWSIKAYSCWSGNQGIREKKPNAKQGAKGPNIDDEKLIRMDPDDSMDDSSDIIGKDQFTTDHISETRSNDTLLIMAHGDDSVAVPDVEVPRPSAPLAQDSAIVDPFAPISSTASSSPHDVSATGITVPTTPSEAPSVLTNTATTAPPRDTTSATPARPRVRLTLRPPNTPTTSASAVNVSATDHHLPDNVTAALPSPEERDAATAPPHAPQANLRLERARVNQDGKRKSDDKSPSVALKRQKTSALAEPTHANSIRNICMHRWNEQQPGGQGLASDFDAYFRSLTDAEKEPFKKEMLSKRATGRKTKAAASKSGNTTTAVQLDAII